MPLTALFHSDNNSCSVIKAMRYASDDIPEAVDVMNTYLRGALLQVRADSRLWGASSESREPLPVKQWPFRNASQCSNEPLSGVSECINHFSVGREKLAVPAVAQV